LDKINPVSRADVDTKFTHTLTDRTNVSRVAMSETLDPSGDAGTRNTIA
jgi:hypothetical protein